MTSELLLCENNTMLYVRRCAYLFQERNKGDRANHRGGGLSTSPTTSRNQQLRWFGQIRHARTSPSVDERMSLNMFRSEGYQSGTVVATLAVEFELARQRSRR